MKRTSSQVWQFFDRLAENKRCVAVLCKLCESQFRYFGNTTNLRSHLIKKHPIQWDMRQTTWEVEKTIEEPPMIHEVTIDEGDESEMDQDSKAAMNLVQQMQNNEGSDEEWLEEEEYPTRIEQPTKHKNLQSKKIKREAASPLQSSNCFATTSAKSARNEHYIVDEILKDEYSVFGQYIANKLRNLKKSRARGNVQQLITTIMWQAEYGKYDDVDSVKRILISAAELPQSIVEPAN